MSDNELELQAELLALRLALQVLIISISSQFGDHPTFAHEVWRGLRFTALGVTPPSSIDTSDVERFRSVVGSKLDELGRDLLDNSDKE